MTASLDLTLTYAAAAPEWRNGIAATLEQLAPPGPHRDFLFPVDRRGLTLTLEAGTYRVQLLMPDGRIYQRQVRLAEGERKSVELEIEGAYTSDESISAAEPLEQEWRSPYELQPAFQQDDEALIWPPEVLMPVELFGTAEDEWTYFASITTNGAHHSLRARGDAAIVGSSDKNKDFQFRWIVAHSGIESQYVCLPSTFDKAFDLDVNLYVDSPHKTTQSLGLRTLEHEFGVVLAYFEQGRLDLAQRMLNVFAKSDVGETQSLNTPLALCAAGYIELALSSRETVGRASDVFSKIDSLPQDISDASILRAQHLIQSPIAQDAVTDALELAKAAYRAGIPHFSTGVQYLRDLLEILGPDDGEARKMAHMVREAGAYLDYRQALTVMHIPKTESKDDVSTEYLSR